MSRFDWLAAFDGIRLYPSLGSPTSHWGSKMLSDVLRRRRNVREERLLGSVEISVGALQEIAGRIDAQSKEIARLQGLGDLIDADRLAGEEARLTAEAERRAARTGVVVRDRAGDRAVLYNRDGKAVEQSTPAILWGRVEDEGWTITEIDADGMLATHGPMFPHELTDFQRTYGEWLRAKRAAEVESALRVFAHRKLVEWDLAE